MDEHEEILREAIADQREKKPRQYWRIIGVVMALLMVVWYIPTPSSPVPRPNDVPSLDSFDLSRLEVERPTGDLQSFISTDAEIKLLATQIVTEACSSPDKRCYAESLYYFVRDNIAYVYDPVSEYYETPEETLLGGSADCDGQTLLLTSLLQSVGIQTEFLYAPQHVYVKAWVPERSWFSREYSYEWLALDPTCTECRPGSLSWR